ncbi:MAG: tetratricopeptide repeat protein [Synergistaceae bacterium]|nr:tetratricopeptide repeat protein [Synergistaceae bacterium]
MRKDLEDWLRGEAQQESLFAAWNVDVAAPDVVRELDYPVIPLSFPLSGRERTPEESTSAESALEASTAEASTNEESASKESMAEESIEESIEKNTIEESIIEKNIIEENIIEENIIQESPTEERGTFEEILSENVTVDELGTPEAKEGSEKIVSEAGIFEDPFAKPLTGPDNEGPPEENEENDDGTREKNDKNDKNENEKENVQIGSAREIHDGEKKHWEFPEWEATRFAQRLRRIEQMRRASTAYKRRGFRGRQGCILSLCVLALFFIGTTFAVYRHLQRNSYSFLMDGAKALYDQEQYEPAFEAYKQVADRYPKRVEPLLDMAHAAERVGRVEEAIMAYRSSLELFPADAAPSRSGVFHEIGRLYVSLKAWDKAQESFQEAAAMDSTNYSAYFALGGALEEQNKPIEAIKAYKHALDLSPSSNAAQEAIRRVSLLLPSAEPKGDALTDQKYQHAIQVGSVALELKHYEEASRYFSEALAIRSDDANVWVGFADARANLGDAAGAVKSLERALAQDPDHEDAQAKLARLKEAQNKKKTPSRSRKTPRSAPRSSKKSTSSKNTSFRATPAGASSGNFVKSLDKTLSKREFFESGVDHYRKGEYAQAFEAFLACLRLQELRLQELRSQGLSSQEREFPPFLSLTGDPGPLWRGFRANLNIPSDVKLLAEAVRINPADRDLYLNLSMTGTKMGLDRKAWRATLNDIHSHALARQ